MGRSAGRSGLGRLELRGAERYRVGFGTLSLSPGWMVSDPLSPGFICRTVLMFTPNHVQTPARVSATLDPLPAGAAPGPLTVYTQQLAVPAQGVRRLIRAAVAPGGHVAVGAAVGLGGAEWNHGSPRWCSIQAKGPDPAAGAGG